MSSTRPRTIRSAIAITLCTACLTAGGTAQARPEPGPNPPSRPVDRCDLQRVGTQFVSCDNLTGNGVPAPLWVSELVPGPPGP